MTYKLGKLSRVYGSGTETPYNPKKSTGQTCGTVNTYDSADKGDKGRYKAKITGKLRAGGTFSYVLKDKFETAYLKGTFTSGRKAAARFRLVSRNTVSNSTCDSGFLKLTLKK